MSMAPEEEVPIRISLNPLARAARSVPERSSVPAPPPTPIVAVGVSVIRVRVAVPPTLLAVVKLISSARTVRALAPAAMEPVAETAMVPPLSSHSTVLSVPMVTLSL